MTVVLPITKPAEVLAALDAEVEDTRALLMLVKVACNLEQRDMNGGSIDGTLGDAAQGLAVLMNHIDDRVAAIHEKATELYSAAIVAGRPSLVPARHVIRAEPETGGVA